MTRAGTILALLLILGVLLFLRQLQKANRYGRLSKLTHAPYCMWWDQIGNETGDCNCGAVRRA